VIKHIIIIVSGRVQGVFYRASAKEQACQLGLKGMVRNLPDGRVYMEAEGPTESMDQFISWCRLGPPRAEVENVEIRDNEIRNYQEFRIVK